MACSDSRTLEDIAPEDTGGHCPSYSHIIMTLFYINQNIPIPFGLNSEQNGALSDMSIKL